MTKKLVHFAYFCGQNLIQLTSKMKIIECPRDAMQGLPQFIATDQKAAYLQQLLSVGFDTLDFGSFVSPKAVPQMQDTAQVLEKLDLSHTKTKLLAVVASKSGAEKACAFPQIQYLGFPLSVSPTFQLRNTKKSIAEAVSCIEQIQELCQKYQKTAVVYLSMCFGNPYGEVFEESQLHQISEQLKNLDIKIIQLSDTIGVSEPTQIRRIFGNLSNDFDKIEWGVHFHSNPKTAIQKIDAAYEAGCRRFDAAIGGFGGCPFAKDELTGNIATEQLLDYFEKKQIDIRLNQGAFGQSIALCRTTFL